MNNETEIKLTAEEIEGTEATFSVWLVKVGDSIKKGDPIAELETDKVAMEICAAKTGFVKSQNIKQGDKVEAGQILGIISDVSSVSYSANNVESNLECHPVASKEKSGLVISADQLNAKQATNKVVDTIMSSKSVDKNVVDKNLISPAVRRLLSENNLNIESVIGNNKQGSGKKGRVTRDDVINFVKTQAEKPELQNEFQQSEPKEVPPERESKNETVAKTPAMKPNKSLNLNSQLIPHTNMRKSIASHMVNSLLETSPHVTSVFEMDMGNLIEHRKWHKKEYSELGVKLTFTAYFLSAMAKAVAKVPQVNAKYHQDALELFSDVNIGVGTALGNAGLVVPVVQKVQSLSLFQIAKELHNKTERARSNKLKQSDMKNGTLTISNHGVSGSLFATPIIINQPQVAILGVGKLEKRVVVEEINGQDEVVIRPKCYVSLSIDHRALDAYQTNLYLTEFVSIIESWGI